MFTHLIDTPSTDATAEPSARERFIRLLLTALHTGSPLKLNLSRYRGDEAGLERVLGRPVMLRGTPCLQLVYRHATKDITKNHPVGEVDALMRQLLGPAFQNAHLTTATQEVQLSVKEKGGRDRSQLRVGRLPGTAAAEPAADDGGEVPAGTGADALAHNRSKQRLLDLGQPCWVDLGLTTPGGQMVPAMARKWKQINRFAEIFSAALAASPLAASRQVRVIDFGCGKGYLTFAMHELLRSQGREAQVMGVELRQELVELCNRSAQAHGLDGLRFDAGDVRSYTPDPVDAMIALHACDTATDFAIHLGLRAGASIIMCSPCCHKQLRPQMNAPALLRPLLQHGIHLGQEAEMVTDGLRALLLDAQGYDTQVFEFISLEHTNKNKMILATRRQRPDPAGHRETVLAQVQALKDFYGIREHCLETLLKA
ncbi:methyltransferase family protein [Sphaerotilus hippei]|uniref:Methyltransferase family protein n=1 Tax=Sphaerotilus hippei TaxID=744406 RepID=A0A318GXW4_9BURK|nr:SAM-dependent methyltransferase [Sphaerotilus hippei]PXW94700.1 methyltransferase family protein [Sphaerotilus hippei]